MSESEGVVTPMPPRRDAIPEELALAEFDRLVSEDCWDLEVDVKKMASAEEKATFEDLRKKIVRAIRRGDAVVDFDAASITYTFRHQPEKLERITSFTLSVPKASVLAGFDRFPPGSLMAKQLAFLGAMCGQDGKIFNQLDFRDMKFFMAVANLFLNS